MPVSSRTTRDLGRRGPAISISPSVCGQDWRTTTTPATSPATMQQHHGHRGVRRPARRSRPGSEDSPAAHQVRHAGHCARRSAAFRREPGSRCVVRRCRSRRRAGGATTRSRRRGREESLLGAGRGARGRRVAGRLLRGAGRERGARARAGVGAVEAGALEDHADRVEDLAQAAGARRADGQRVVAEALHLLERVPALGAGVLVGRHDSGTSGRSWTDRGWHSHLPTAKDTAPVENAAARSRIDLASTACPEPLPPTDRPVSAWPTCAASYGARCCAAAGCSARCASAARCSPGCRRPRRRHRRRCRC